MPRQSDFEDVGGPFFLDPDSHAGDLIEDDQSMWFETDDGLVILLGCCHAGLSNTVEHIRKFSGIQKVKGIIGGMHLVNADQNRLDRTFAVMKEWKPAFLVPCHCTGAPQGDKCKMLWARTSSTSAMLAWRSTSVPCALPECVSPNEKASASGGFFAISK